MNNYAINLINGQQPCYELLYSYSLVKLMILKTYIEINLAKSFIISSIFPSSALIHFVWKPDSSFQPCENYKDLTNKTIQNQYPLPLIGFDLTIAYQQMRIRKKDNWKIIFPTRYNYFEYLIMPFCLYNTLTSFLRYIIKILGKKLDVFLIV